MGIGEPIVTVYCDVKNCVSEEEFEMTPLAQNRFDNRNLPGKMKRAGWTLDGSSVYCPDCSESMKEADPNA